VRRVPQATMMMGTAHTPDARLLLAAQKNDAAGVRHELALGADVDYLDPIFCWTALHISSLDGKVDTVQVPPPPSRHSPFHVLPRPAPFC
jgi:hypothetical protein